MQASQPANESKQAPDAILEKTQIANKVSSPVVIDQDDDEEDEPYELDYDLCEG